MNKVIVDFKPPEIEPHKITSLFQDDTGEVFMLIRRVDQYACVSLSNDRTSSGWYKNIEEACQDVKPLGPCTITITKLEPRK